MRLGCLVRFVKSFDGWSLRGVGENRAGRQYKNGFQLVEVEADRLFRFGTEAQTLSRRGTPRVRLA